MARLYPPSIAGVLPSFYENDGAVVITVPFSHNKIVSTTSAKCCKLRLKRIDTDSIIGLIDSSTSTWSADAEAESVDFDITSIQSKLYIGTSYKAQIAYVSTSDEIGYYSTVGIIKYTAEPAINIIGLNETTATAVSELIGQYTNDDRTERVEYFKYQLCDNTGLVVDEIDWTIHSATNDNGTTTTEDVLPLSYHLTENITYSLIYSVQTYSGLIVSTTPLLLKANSSGTASINGTVVATLNYDIGGIVIKIQKANNQDESGYFKLKRRVSGENTEITLYKFGFTSYDGSDIFTDLTVESGVTYIYSIEKYDGTTVYVSADSAPVTAYFEFTYLSDNTHQLCLMFNNKISSFKTVVTETKKNTLGGKYPYFFKNGNNNYKEFNINGLISYLMDESHLFWNEGPTVFNTDCTDVNINNEKEFKLKVLNWLNDGGIKMFRSPTEGNYLVRITNVSLSPEEAVYRMLHNFSCTADEAAEINQENLVKYGFGCGN